jgi:hypothetical protein
MSENSIDVYNYTSFKTIITLRNEPSREDPNPPAISNLPLLANQAGFFSVLNQSDATSFRQGYRITAQFLSKDDVEISSSSTQIQRGEAAIFSSDRAGLIEVRVYNQNSIGIGISSPAPCFLSGTQILTDRGNMEVENLLPGDLLLTSAQVFRPIRWIGSRHYPGLSTPEADRPVRIRASALQDGVPSRDLVVSPDHALWLDGLFVAAGHLVNGISIIRGEVVANLTYWHIELDSHDLLLAENTLAESFLAAPAVRAGFDGVQPLDARAAPVPYATRSEIGPQLSALRGRLIRRAISSYEATSMGPVRAWLDRCVVGTDGLLHVGGWAQDVVRPDTPVCLDVMVDGAVVAFTVASVYRADLAVAGMGDGRLGFDLGLAVPLASGAPHVVEVRRSADGALVCAKQIDAAGIWTPLLAA